MINANKCKNEQEIYFENEDCIGNDEYYKQKHTE